MKFILDLYFKLFRVLFNKLPIPTNKTSKSNWDWLQLNKNETFTKTLGAFVFYGFFGLILIIFNYCINSFLIYNILSKFNDSVTDIVNNIANLKIFYNTLEIIYFALWFITLFVIVKNHNKKPNIQKIK